MSRVLILILMALPAVAATPWKGALRLGLDGEALRAGSTITLTPRAVTVHKDGREEPIAGVMDGRGLTVELVPYRFNQFADAALPVAVERTGAEGAELRIPADLATGWYLLTATAHDDHGHPVPVAKASTDREYANHLETKVVVVRGRDDGPFVRLHTERARSVFSPGERIRLNVSARGANGVSGPVVVALYPAEGVEGKPLPVASGELTAAAGQEQTLSFDLSSAATAAIAPGDYRLVAVHAKRPADVYPVRLVAPERPGGGGRWAHTMPSGTSGGLDGDRTLPATLDGGRFRGHRDRVLGRIHQANLWVNFFANRYPIVGPGQDLPQADDPTMPPAAAEYRPSLTHAFYESLMAEGIALGICVGYGEDYKAEVYMPIPTVLEDQIATMARKYLAGGLGAAQWPHFVALYTDFYGHIDSDGAGEISDEQLTAIRDATWERASAAAGFEVDRPPRYEFDHKRLPEAHSAPFKDGSTRKKWGEFLAAQREAHGGDKQWFDHLPPDEQARVWAGAWAAIGHPAPRLTYVPRPTLDAATAELVGPQAAYDYASWILSGVGRAYGAFTAAVESELPAVFTIHNKGTMNHSSVSHAWSGTRTPNIDPAYLGDGASAISVSEWNLDGVPKPYFLTTFYNRRLVDQGHPVYRSGLWKQAGSPTRWMRDAVFWGGRQIQTYFDQAGNMSWSHQGADQTTYAANERMASVAAFCNRYGDLFSALEPVREVGLYVPPVGDPWGSGATRGHYVAMVASLMSDHQVHMVSHADLDDAALMDRYPILYAPSIHGPDSFYPFELDGLRAYVERGGQIVVSQAPDYYHPEAAYTEHGISMRKVPQLDEDGEPRTNKDGSPRLEAEWTATPEQWAAVTREYVWGAFDQGVTAAPIDVHQLFTHLDDGEPATWSGRHWTGHHEWARYRGSALHQHAALAAVYDRLLAPAVRKDQPEVFVNLCAPKDGSAGRYLFASNWTLPTHEDLFELRVPQGFFKSMVQPVRCELRVRAEGIGAVYDLIGARAVPFERVGERLVFTADLDSVEGRIYALFPEAVASAALLAPTGAPAGSRIAPRFELRGASGAALGVLGTVTVEMLAADGRQLLELHRVLPGDGALPPIDLPATAGERVTLRVTDTVSGQVASAAIAIEPRRPVLAEPADAVTTYRGDAIHRWLGSADRLRIVADGDGADALAGELGRALASAGISAAVVDSETAIAGELHAHPWAGKMARYRQRHTVPGVRMDGPVIVVGDPATSPLLGEMERALVAGRALDRASTGAGRAVVAWAARAFAIDHDAVVVACSDAAGARAAGERLAALAAADPGPDPYYAARERLRFAWTPREVERWKAQRALAPAASAVAELPLVETTAAPGWSGLTDAIGTAIFALDASQGGVAVGTKSWARPTGLLTPDGGVVGFWGGGAEVTPRDVGVAADGARAYAGYSLLGRAAGYAAEGRFFSQITPVVYKDRNPFEWDSFKDSDRHIGMSPDHRTVVVNGGAEGIYALDASTGAERWRIPGTANEGRPRGAAHPEIAFSSDSGSVLLAPYVADGRLTISYEVEVEAWDPERRRYDRKRKSAQRVTREVEARRQQLMLVDVASGVPRWTVTTDYALYDLETGGFVWAPGKAPELPVRDDPNDGRDRSWSGADDAVPTVDGAPVDPGDLVRMPFWHLYSAVGPGGAWTIAGTRDAAFSLFDEEGVLLRTWEPRQLPSALDPGDMIPPTILAGDRPDRLIAFAAQSRSAFLFELRVGSVEERRAARAAERENQRLITDIKRELTDRSNYGEYDKQAFLDAFGQRIAAVPDELRRELLDRMQRIPAERRAGRKRDYRFFEAIVERIEQRLFEDDRQLLDRAVGLRQERELELPDMIHDARADQAFATLYAGLWDGTVRAYDLATGEQRWSTSVIGGCRIALVRDAQGGVEALYAGGTRGDLYRLDPVSGAVLWHRNVTAATNALE